MRRRVLLTGFGVLALIQILQPLWGVTGARRLWPFCAYDMFAFRVSQPTRTLRVVLEDDAGDKTMVAPGNVLPMEFFRAAGVIDSIYRRGHDEQKKQQLARDILARLEDEPWRPFDETWHAARPRPGHRFVAFDVQEIEQEIRMTDRGAVLVDLVVHPLFHHAAQP